MDDATPAALEHTRAVLIERLKRIDDRMAGVADRCLDAHLTGDVAGERAAVSRLELCRAQLASVSTILAHVERLLAQEAPAATGRWL